MKPYVLPEELRHAVLERDPDGIVWKIQSEKPGATRTAQSFLEAILSLLTNLDGFRRLFGERVRHHIAKLRQDCSVIDAQPAVEAAQLEVLRELERERAQMVVEGLLSLGRYHFVPREKLMPQFLGQDWSSSSLTESGVLDLRMALWLYESPNARAHVERRRRIRIRREATCVEVQQP